MSKDCVEAYKWITLAWRHDDAENLPTAVGERMSKEQISESLRLARQFKPLKSPEAGVSGLIQPTEP